ncbi:general substrate transporter [Talaromyces proteolyticus]|uniref:General substrate transporter n=1 Tax=Talaromyces proteolyticus TaxID=1131652 RepID=A0AAD4Q1Q9_9EURO|nr:general substrate transporter [Talaromyces proteolyticus]KAH8698760.1 general substrate transporter [Talaromyces proteolyticus]
MARLTLYNVFVCLGVALAAYAYGFGFAVFGTSIGQPGFYQYFDLDRNSIIGAVNSLFAFGSLVGAIIQASIADRFGRRKALAVGAVWALVGGALTAGSVTISMLIVVRIFQGLGLGMLICLVQLYLTEVAPAHRRGLLSGLTAMSLAFGYVVCAWISVGTYSSTNLTLQWRLPLSLACVGPLGLLICLPFVPESPRWLSWTGQDDEAWKVISRLHHDPNDPTDAAARAELFQIKAQVEMDKLEKPGYRQILSKPSWRHRAILVFFIQFASQSTGVLGINNFSILIYQSLGMGGRMSLIMYGLYAIVGTGANWIVGLTVDRVGRRTSFLIGFPLCAICLLIEAVLQSQYLGTDNKAGNAGCLVLLFAYISVYEFVDVASYIWPAEVFPTTIRAKGLGITMAGYFLGAITYTTPSALAFKNIKWGMYLLWMGLCIVSTIITYFFIPETKNIPLEELGAFFGDEIAVHLTGDEDDKEKAEVVHKA